MSVRAAQALLVVVCTLGLAIAGTGWHSEGNGKPLQPRAVYCDVSALMRYHPAYEQWASARGESGAGRPAPGPESSSTGLTEQDVPDGEPAVTSESREMLQARLLSRSEEELSKARERLMHSLDREVAGKRQELEANYKAAEAIAARVSNERLAHSLRTVGEAYGAQRVPVELKLAALRSQRSVAGSNRDQPQRAILDREKELAALTSRLAREEADLKNSADAALKNLNTQHKIDLDRELAVIREQGTQRIEVALAERRERMSRDPAPPRLSAVASMPRETDGAQPEVVEKAGKAGAIRAAAWPPTGARAAAGAGRDIVPLGDRIRRELKETVQQIARENGLEVSYTSDGRSPDRTNWFRDRLPYVTVRG